MKRAILSILALAILIPSVIQAAPISWDFTSGVLQPLQSAWGANVRVPNITATSSATNTLPVLAVPTRFSFGGAIGTAWSDFCVAITGGSGLCDGADATGAGGGGISTSSTPTTGQLAVWTSPSALSSIATTSLGLTFLSLSDTPSSYTPWRIPYTNTAGTALTDSANLVFDGVDLGIGTTTPFRPLSVNGSSVFTSEMALSGTAANIALGQNFLSGDGGDEGVFINSVGRVGIGTTTPSHPLSVFSTDGFSPTVLFENTGLGTGTEVLLTLRAPLTTGLTTGRLLQTIVPGESFARAFWYSDGAYCAGPGSATRDVCYSRSATNTLQIDSNKSGGSANLRVTGNLTVGSLNGLLAGNNGLVSALATSSLNIDLANTVGTLAATRGGTGLTSYATGDLIYASGANTLANRTIGSTGNVLSVVGGVPTWVATGTLGIAGGGGSTSWGSITGTLSSQTDLQTALDGKVNDTGDTITGSLTIQGTSTQATTTVSRLNIGSLTGFLKATAGTVATSLVNLASDVTGFLGLTNGGTGTSTAPTTDQILVGNAAGSYDYRRIVAGTNVTVSTSTAGQIQISATGGGGGLSDPLTTNGDIIARISGATTRLAQGANGTFLGVSGGLLGYYTPAGGGFTVGPTSTQIWRSTLQGGTFPDGQYVNSEIQATRFHTIKPIWYEVTATGNLFLRPASSTQPFGFNATNTQIIKENSSEQFVTVSGNNPEIHVLTASSTLVTSSINTLIAFATSTGFTGIELDWEGFGTWAAASTTNYINYVTQLSNEAHKYGLKTMIYLPPIWNSAANSESGTGDEWDSANSDGYYQLEYEDFENVPVDYLVIAVYDYHFDYGAGRPNAPLKWQDEVISYAKRKISDHDRLIIGIPGAGYGGATGGYSFTAYTYASSTAIAGFSGATRDAESGELTWTNGGNSYFACDDTCINTKRARAEREGISRVSVWHIGGNTYGSGKAEPTIAEPPATIQTGAKFFGELGGYITQFFSSTGAAVVDFKDTLATFYTNIRTTGTITMVATSSPATPAAGEVTIFGRTIAGRSLPAYIGPSGLDSTLQPLLARNKVGYWNPPGNGTTVPGVFGFTAPTVTGFTATARNVATKSLFTRMRRLGYVTAATAGAVGQWRVAASQYTVGSSTTPIGGFTYIVRFGISDAAAVSDARMFMGMGQGGTTPTNVEPSTVVNAVGMCHGAADTNFKICYGGSSAQTPIDLGANFPSNTRSTDMYELALFAAPNTGDIKYEVTRLNTGAVATGTISNTSAAVLPQNGTLMAPWGYRTNNATALAVGLDVASAYIETDY